MGLSAITHSHLLLCEGMHDVQFFHYLREARGLPTFQAVSCGNIAGSPAGRDGIDYLTSALNALPAIPNFFSRLHNILIIADNDGNPTDSLQKVQRYINAAMDIQPGQRYAVPPRDQVKAGTNPSMTILMLPWSGQVGALDTLCLTAACNKRPGTASCVNAFAACVNSMGWAPPREDKMKLRALMSAAHDDPYISPAWVWRDGTDLVPLDDPIFAQIETF